MSFSRLLRFSDPSSIALLGVMLMASSTFIYYFYSKAPSSNSFEPKKEESSSNSSEPKKEESSSNSSAPKKEGSSSNSSEPKIMASTSTSSIQSSFQYDVFISFRGEDTRKTFVGHLYQALKDKGIATFKDDERMKQGKTIDNQLIKAIKDSRFFIIVFSKNYASSSWCLDELVEIMECQKTGDQTAYPIFLDVEPTQVRKQSGEFGEAFKENKKKDAAGKWIEALKGASNLVGRELQATANGNEAEFIKKIVGEISLELRSINFDFDEKLVGMETRVKDVVSYFEIGIDDVRIIGIKGMGGAGKTTTARAVFDHMSIDFEAKSFVENVRDVSNASMFGLKYLQEVLSDVLNEHVTVKGVIDGKNMMKRRMCGIKVLLVLDDVDHIEQLKALAGKPEWFKPGSRILITTRDEQVLVAHRVNMIRDIVLLSKQEAISLFSRYAFGRENPLEGYKELSGKVVHYADGLPLTLEVLGSFLCGKDKDEWEDAIERLKNIPLKETMEKLELSYIGLEDDYKEIFLDIACILKGKSKEDAIVILESCGFHARIGLKVLKQRSLITISGYDEVLGMHDHIEEMGKDIVRRSHTEEPNKHSRLWISEEIEDIFAEDKGTEATRCLKLTTSRRNSRIVMKGLVKMKKLRYLEVNFSYYDVFMSFRGEDTRKNFVDHLYHALQHKGISIYRDDVKIQKGKTITDELIKSIKTSEFYIIVFSKNYASSSWCLEELVKIMECHKMTEHTAYPVFYDVEPREVRKQSGAVGEAFAKHEKEVRNQSGAVRIAFSMNKKKAMLKKWRGALKEAASLAGWELKNTLDGSEAKLIKKIVEDISLELHSINSGVVGLEMVLDKLKFVSLSPSKLSSSPYQLLRVKNL